MGFTVTRVLRRVLSKGSEKGVSRRCPERPLGGYDPLGVRPSQIAFPPPRPRKGLILRIFN